MKDVIDNALDKCGQLAELIRIIKNGGEETPRLLYDLAVEKCNEISVLLTTGKEGHACAGSTSGAENTSETAMSDSAVPDINEAEGADLSCADVFATADTDNIPATPLPATGCFTDTDNEGATQGACEDEETEVGAEPDTEEGTQGTCEEAGTDVEARTDNVGAIQGACENAETEVGAGPDIEEATQDACENAETEVGAGTDTERATQGACENAETEVGAGPDTEGTPSPSHTAEPHFSADSAEEICTGAITEDIPNNETASGRAEDNRVENDTAREEIFNENPSGQGDADITGLQNGVFTDNTTEGGDVFSSLEAATVNPSEKLEKGKGRKIKSVREVLSINDLYLFKRELFNNDVKEMNSLFDKLDKAVSPDECERILNGYINFEPEDESPAAEFFERLKNRF